MTMFTMIFGLGAGFSGIGINHADALRALSAEEMQLAAQKQARQQMQAATNSTWGLLLQNYRPHVDVPLGWAEWFACGDSLH